MSTLKRPPFPLTARVEFFAGEARRLQEALRTLPEGPQYRATAAALVALHARLRYYYQRRAQLKLDSTLFEGLSL